MKEVLKLKDVNDFDALKKYGFEICKDWNGAIFGYQINRISDYDRDLTENLFISIETRIMELGIGDDGGDDCIGSYANKDFLPIIAHMVLDNMVDIEEVKGGKVND